MQALCEAKLVPSRQISVTATTARKEIKNRPYLLKYGSLNKVCWYMLRSPEHRHDVLLVWAILPDIRLGFSAIHRFRDACFSAG